MLYDFLLLEQYFEAPDTVRFYEELSEKYGTTPIRKAVAAGDLLKRKIVIGPDAGRWMLWLSEKGRAKAKQERAYI